ncbi:MAG TPA: VWA domain-containing protein [Gammaproteobacteria bacterium]|nr:VWA domain-containing protein [Gammaproteobacteria bacterium]
MIRKSFARFACLAVTLYLAIGMLPAYAEQDVVLLLDNSGSMRANDPQRLASKAVSDFVASQGPDTRISVIEFSTAPRILMPLTPLTTSSRTKVGEVLKAINYRGQWTDTAAALERAVYELSNSGRDTAQKYIILMTDGHVDVGNDIRDNEKIGWINQSLIPQAARQHIRIFGIAFTEQADYELLQTLAVKTGADYFRAYHDQDLAGIFQRVGDTLLNARLTPAAQPNVATPIPAAAQKDFQFNTPLTKPVEQSGSHTGWEWLAVLVLILILGAGIYLLWNRTAVRKALQQFGSHQPEHAEGPQAVLYDISNPNDIKRYELTEKSTVIGRVSGYDPEVQYVVANEATIGRCHAVIEHRGRVFWITDQGSINGTFVNGERLTGDRALKHGDIVAVHRHEFEFVIPELFESDATVLAARDRPASQAG